MWVFFCASVFSSDRRGVYTTANSPSSDALMPVCKSLLISTAAGEAAPSGFFRDGLPSPAVPHGLPSDGGRFKGMAHGLVIAGNTVREALRG